MSDEIKFILIVGCAFSFVIAVDRITEVHKTYVIANSTNPIATACAIDSGKIRESQMCVMSAKHGDSEK